VQKCSSSQVARSQDLIYIKSNLKKQACFCFPKVFEKFKNGQKKCPKMGNGNTFAKIPSKTSIPYPNALVHRKNDYDFVTTIFYTFLQNRFRNFFCYHINGKK
jgi:hypothetical protein